MSNKKDHTILNKQSRNLEVAYMVSCLHDEK